MQHSKDSPLVSQIAAILSSDDLAYLPWDPSSDPAYEEMARRTIVALPESSNVRDVVSVLRIICDSESSRGDVRYEARLARAARDIYDCWIIANGHKPQVIRSITVEEFDHQLRNLFALQNSLVLRLEATHGKLGPSQYEWPKRGILEHEGQSWAFHRHGLGFAFECHTDGRVVEAHDLLETRPIPLDDWRIECFLDSLGLYGIRNDDEERGLCQPTFETILGQLIEEGSWIAGSTENGRAIYLPSTR